MISTAVVQRYAGALADLVVAPESGLAPETVVEQLRSFETAILEAPGLRLVLASPAVSTSRKRAAIRRIADALGIAPLIRNFILVLSDHRRAALLTPVIDSFELLVDERRGFVPGEIRSAAALSEPERQTLAGELGRLAGAQVRLRFTVDPNLIGGVMARIGSTVYDGSVRGQLAALRTRLAVTA
jgi:F-type H+-transporting ATPase subunit delta